MTTKPYELEILNMAKARRELNSFLYRMSPTLLRAEHTNRIIAELEAVERGENDRLIICLPPGAGKSTVVSSYVAWTLGRSPTKRIISASATAELALRNSGMTKALVEDRERWPFPETAMSRTSFAESRWELSSRGGLYATSVGGSVTGWRAGLIVCDDLLHDASSENERANTNTWFDTVLVPRLEPGGAIVLIGTRWHEEDPIGRLLAGPNHKDWRVLNIPAIGEDGASYWPQRWSAEELERRRSEMGSRAFESQYQGNPLPPAGLLFKFEWLKQRYTANFERGVDTSIFNRVVSAIDAASKTGIANDYSVMVTVGIFKNAFYLLDVTRKKVEYPGLLQMVLDTCKRWQPNSILVEDTSNAVALVQELKVASRLPIVPITPKGSKISRMEGITGIVESGRLRLPEEAPWLAEFEHEFLAAPNGKHDDMIDALVLVLSRFAHYRPMEFDTAGGVFAVRSQLYDPRV